MTAVTSISDICCTENLDTGAPSTAITLQMVEDAAVLIRDTHKVGLYSCRLFPGTNTTSFKADDGEVFHVASPGFWAAIVARVAADSVGSPLPCLWGIPLINLDLDLGERSRVMTAMLKAIGDFSGVGQVGKA